MPSIEDLQQNESTHPVGLALSETEMQFMLIGIDRFFLIKGSNCTVSDNGRLFGDPAHKSTKTLSDRIHN